MDFIKGGVDRGGDRGNPVYLIEPAEGYEDSVTLTLDAVEGANCLAERGYSCPSELRDQSSFSWHCGGG